MSTSSMPTATTVTDIPEAMPHGVNMLHNPLFNRGTGFSAAEREAFGLRGLLPARVLSMQDQAARILENLSLIHI